jgi:hypothetical protein
MLRRHRPALAKFAATSKIENLAFLVAHRHSTVGQAMLKLVPVTGRASYVLPLSVQDVPALLSTLGLEGLKESLTKKGLVPVVVIEEANTVAVSFEPLVTTPENRAITA